MKGRAKGEARVAVRQRVATAVTALEAGIQGLRDSEAWRRYLEVQARFHRYSFGNCLLIAMQRPDATQVAGYRTWQGLGRQVRAGERGITILAPSFWHKARPAKSDNGEEMAEDVVIHSYRDVKVFDVSQTEGDPLPEVGHRLRGETDPALVAGLEGVAQSLGYRVERGCVFPDGRGGDVDLVAKVIRLNGEVDPAHSAKTLLHELAHVALDHRGNGEARMSRASEELEAESVAYIVASKMGMGVEAGEYSFGYVLCWAGERDAVAQVRLHGDRIQRVAHRILEMLEGEKLSKQEEGLT